MITKCHFTAADKLEMIVVVRDIHNLIQTDFASSNDAVEVYFDANKDGNVDLGATNLADGKCGVDQTNNNIQYFKVKATARTNQADTLYAD